MPILGGVGAPGKPDGGLGMFAADAIGLGFGKTGVKFCYIEPAFWCRVFVDKYWFVCFLFSTRSLSVFVMLITVP